MSFKIKKSGWAWKLHREFNSEVYQRLLGDESVGLCLYFWNTLLQIFKQVGTYLAVGVVLLLLSVAAVGGLALTINALIGLVSAAFGVFLPWIHYGLAATVVFILLFVVLLFIIVESFLHLIGSNSASMNVVPTYIKKIVTVKETTESKQDNLFLSYWKAFKSKVCPIVELDKGE